MIEQVGQLLLKYTSVSVLLCALQLGDLSEVQPIKPFKDPCSRDAWSICCFWWIQKEEMVFGFLAKKVEVRNGLVTEEKKGLRAASAENLNILGLEREVLKIKPLNRLKSSYRFSSLKN